MGIEDRSYYRDEYESQGPFSRMGQGRTTGPRTVVAWLIIINIAIWIICAFSPMNDAALHEDFDRLDASNASQTRDGFVTISELDTANGLGEREKSLILAADTNKDSAVSFREFRNRFGKRQLTEWLALNTDLVRRPWEAWRLATYGFVHDDKGIWHLAGNMLVLFFLGRSVEWKLGAEEFIKFYMIALLFAGLVWLAVNLLRGIPASAVGASGAISAVVGLFVFHFPRQQVLLFFVIPMPAWVLGVLIVVFDIFHSLSTQSSVAGEAHLAGFAFAAMFFYFNWNLRWLKLDVFKSLFNRKPKLRVHNPETRDQAAEKLSQQADRILQKVHEQGQESLTRQERKILMKHSRAVRKNKS